MNTMNAEDFLKKTGMEEPMAPGMIKYRYVTGDKEGGSYTIVYDWRSDLEKIRVEVRPGVGCAGCSCCKTDTRSRKNNAIR